jgi:tRNA 5-methylaminomethyl-2-thiouridine biosynthesis bifunctional protein
MIRTDPRIKVTRLEFKDSRTPYSAQFQDVYFAPSSGIEESAYVYLEGSGFLDSLARGA